LELCREINPNQEAIFIPVVPDSNFPVNECFFNVRSKVEKEGGQLQYGWAIWLWPDVLLEAEFHAVWVSTSGALTDITPKEDGAPRILFLPDDSRQFDFNSCHQVDNIRKALFPEDPQTAEMITLAEKRYALMQKYSVSLREFRVPRALYNPIVQRIEELRVFLSNSPIKRNAPCPCGSLKKYKRCCGDM
jgi:hypothetical protein